MKKILTVFAVAAIFSGLFVSCAKDEKKDANSMSYQPLYEAANAQEDGTAANFASSLDSTSSIEDLVNAVENAKEQYEAAISN